MKKIFIICFMFVLMFITGCTEETPLALMKMREFDKANSSEFTLSLGMGSGEIELFKYGYKENEFVCLEVLQDVNVSYITNLENNYQYYDGFMWDGKVKLSETEVKEVKFLDYSQEMMIEKIIYWSTIYGDSKKFLKERIQEEYGHCLSESKLKQLC